MICGNCGRDFNAGLSQIPIVSMLICAAVNSVDELYEIGNQILTGRNLGTLGGHITWELQWQFIL